MKESHTRSLSTLALVVTFAAVTERTHAGACGDGFCLGENSCTCPQDCVRTTCAPCDCGQFEGTGCFCDDMCLFLGDCCDNACEICGQCPGTCGENGCEPDENCFSCPQDCGQCIGACCFNDTVAGGANGCEELTRSNCLDRGGAYQGDLTSCSNGPCEPRGACCVGENDLQVAGNNHVNCTETSEAQCVEGFGGEYQGDDTSCEAHPCHAKRVSDTQKGSLLIFSDVELEWTNGPGTFNLTKDTVISLVNDYPGEVFVQVYFINGDPEKEAVFSSGPAPILITEAEPGCNWVDCQFMLTPDQPMYWSAATGNPLGCQPFHILDANMGNGPGRPNPEVPGGPRVLRGYIVAWAVNADGKEVNWNHLSGKATIVDYAAQAAWEYNAWAFQARFGEHGESLPGSGIIFLDGFEYETAFDMLLFDFFAANSGAFSNGTNIVNVDTDLTLHPVTVDLRQEHDEPITTKAHFDIWNMNERKLSNTRRCITCWDQVLLSRFNNPNTFLLVNLQSDKGKARIDGKQANECEDNCFHEEDPDFAPDNQTAGFLDDVLDLEFVCSQDASLLGVAAKTLRFGGNSIDYAGNELVGMGVERASVFYDITDPPGSLRDEAFERIRRSTIEPKFDRPDGRIKHGK